MGSSRLIEFDLSRGVPQTPEALLRESGRPFVVRVQGKDPHRTRALSTLLHGNEPSGVRALHALLREGMTPATNLLAFVGSVGAATAPPGFAHRALPGRPDLNRCFVPPFEEGERALAGEVLDVLRSARPEALIDIHNTTGHTPPYGVGTIVGDHQLHLVSLFAGAYVHSDLRLGTLVEATENDFPSVVVECGLAGSAAADDLARAGLARYLSAGTLAPDPVAAGKVRVTGTPIRVSVRTGERLAFGDAPEPGADLTVRSGIDTRNFTPMRAGEIIGWLGGGGAWPLWAVGAEGRDLSRELFTARGNVLETRRDIIPIMMTTDPEIAISDCLFYVVSDCSSGGEGTRGAA